MSSRVQRVPPLGQRPNAELRQEARGHQRQARRHGHSLLQCLGHSRRRAVDARRPGARLRPPSARQAALLGHVGGGRHGRVPPAHRERDNGRRGPLLLSGRARRRLDHEAGGQSQADRARGSRDLARDRLRGREAQAGDNL